MAGTASNRFATSALSRKNKASAIPEEILVHKHTGQTLIKTAEGDIVSYDSMARLKNHLERVSLFAQSNGLRGDISSVEFDDRELPEVVGEGENLLSEPLTLKPGPDNVKRFTFSLDVDTLELSESDTIGLEPIVEIKYEVGFKKAMIRATASSVASKIADPSALFIDAAPGATLVVTSIRVIKNDAYDESAQLRHIVHSILTIIE